MMLAFIWGHSLMPGDMSSMESEWFLALVRPVVAALRRVLLVLGRDYDESFLVRKLAHFSEYAVLGVLMYLLFVKPDGRSRYFMPMLLCLGSAGIDEGIQIFAVDRGPALRDVIIDFTGSCVGIFAMALIIVIVYGVKNRRHYEDPYR